MLAFIRHQISRHHPRRGYLRPLIALLVIMQLLAANEEVPEWYSNLPSEDGVLYGVGAGNSPAEAQDVAKASIASQLLASVDAQRQTMKARVTVSDGENEASQTVSAFSQHITTAARAHYLPGAEVVRQEKVGKKTYALVRLEKERFKQAARHRIAEIDAVLSKLAPRPARITGARLAALRRALPMAEEREALALQLAGTGETVAGTPLTADAIRTQLGLLITPGTIAFRGDAQAAEVRDAVVQCLADLDLSVVEGDSARFETRLQQKRQSTTLPNGWVKVHLSGTLIVVNAETGETIGSLSASENATSTTENLALDKARQKFVAALANEINDKLLTILIRGKPE